MLKALGIALMIISGTTMIFLPEWSWLWRHFPVTMSTGKAAEKDMARQARWADRTRRIWRRVWPYAVAVFLIGLTLAILGR